MSADWRHGLPHLHGSGVLLREPRLTDAAALQLHLASPHVTRFIDAPPVSVDDFAQFIAWVQGERRVGRHVCFAVIPEAVGEAAGLVHIRGIEPGFGSAQWGFALAESYWGTGLFVAGARLALDFVFRDMGVHRLEARVTLGNGRSSGALRKLGATSEGVLRQSLSHEGRRADEVLWAIIGEDWLAANAGAARRSFPPDDDLPPMEPPPIQPSVATWRRGLPVLRAAGVTLRELVPDDAGTLVRLFNDPEVIRYIPPPPTTEDEFARFIHWTRTRREAGTMICMGMVPDAHTAAQGVLQLHELEAPFRIADWGVVVGRPHWGTGLFERSARLFLPFAFDTIGVQRIEARAVAEDERANRALQRLGAAREGRLRRSFLLAGEYHDDVIWSLLDTEWRQRHAVAR